jgi:pilus assembly protein CpaB
MISERPGMNQPGSEAARIISPGLVAISIPISRLSSLVYGIRDGDRVNVIATTLFVDMDATFQTILPNFTAQVTGVGFTPDKLPTLSTGVVSGGPGSAQGRAELDPTLNQALYLVPSEAQRPRLVSQMILQDIQVLHMGNFSLQTQEAAAPAAGQPAPTPAPPPIPDTITLIVSPQDAVALTYLMHTGTRFNLTLRAPDDTTRVETEAATLQYLLSQYAIPVPAKLPYGMEPSITALTEPTAAP